MAFVGHEACPVCPSSDGLARYDDGGAHCFVCGHHEAGGAEPARIQLSVPGRADPLGPPPAFERVEGDYWPLTKRALDEVTCRHFGYRVGTFGGEEAQIADFHDARGRLVAQHIRLPGKQFRWVGDAKAAGFFGQRRASASKAFRLYVTEGEIDAMSVSQVKGHRWPVVSLKNGAAGAAKEFAAQVDWLDQFREIVLCFDTDKPGEEAALACAEILPHKVKIARLPRKDANEMLVAGEVAALIEAIDGAVAYRPAGIVEGVELIDRILEQPARGLEYPWPCLNRLTHGMRLGEMTTWCAGTGVGKSQVLREVMFHIRQHHGMLVGGILLEESTRHSALAQVSLAMNTPLHIPARRDLVPDEEIRSVAGHVLQGVYFYDHFGSITADAILPKVRYLHHALGVNHIVLDHLSIMVSGMAADGDERKRIDQIVTALRTQVQELGIGLHIISHLRKPSGTPFEEGGTVSLVDLRGSGSIAQLSDMVIALERHQQGDDAERHITRVRVLKNRFSGETGEAGRLAYNPETGRLTEAPTVAPVVVDGQEVRDF